MAAAEAPIKVDGATLVIALGSRPPVWFVSEYDTASVRQLEPPFEPHDLRLKDIWPAEQIPQCRLTCMKEKVANPAIYSVYRVRRIDLDESGV